MHPTGIRLLLDKLPTPVGSMLVLIDNESNLETKIKVVRVIKELNTADILLKDIHAEDICRKLVELGYVEDVPQVNAEVILYFGPISDDEKLK